MPVQSQWLGCLWWPRTKILCWCPRSGSCQIPARSPVPGWVILTASPSPISPSPTKGAPRTAELLKSPHRSHPVRAKAILGFWAGVPEVDSGPPEPAGTTEPRRRWSSFQQFRCLHSDQKHHLIAIQTTPSSHIHSGLPTDSGKFSQGRIFIRLKEHAKAMGSPGKGFDMR